MGRAMPPITDGFDLRRSRDGWGAGTKERCHESLSRKPPESLVSSFGQLRLLKSLAQNVWSLVRKEPMPDAHGRVGSLLARHIIFNWFVCS
jgi:hypothetical protein